MQKFDDFTKFLHAVKYIIYFIFYDKVFKGNFDRFGSAIREFPLAEIKAMLLKQIISIECYIINTDRWDLNIFFLFSFGVAKLVTNGLFLLS